MGVIHEPRSSHPLSPVPSPLRSASSALLSRPHLSEDSPLIGPEQKQRREGGDHVPPPRFGSVDTQSQTEASLSRPAAPSLNISHPTFSSTCRGSILPATPAQSLHAASALPREHAATICKYPTAGAGRTASRLGRKPSLPGSDEGIQPNGEGAKTPALLANFNPIGSFDAGPSPQTPPPSETCFMPAEDLDSGAALNPGINSFRVTVAL